MYRVLIVLLIVAGVQGCTLRKAGAPAKAPLPTVPAAQVHAAGGCIIDSSMTLPEAIGNPRVPAQIARQLTLVTVHYFAMDGTRHQGQLVANRRVASDLAAIFREIERSKFPIASVIPVSKYRNDDALSMAANNTSCFNYRRVPGTHTWSQHAVGKAIDINPMQNPYCPRRGVSPAGAHYNPQTRGTIVPGSPVYQAFMRRGWFWGGRWKREKDYQHFQKGR